MRKFLLLCLLPYIMSATTGPHPNNVRRAWQDACRLSQYSCKRLKMPRAAYDHTLKQRLLLGEYTGGDTVTVQPGLDDITLRLILTHEVVHYLQAQRGAIKIPFPDHKQSCRAEREAWHVWNVLAAELGHFDQQRPNWASSYLCTPEDLK